MSIDVTFFEQQSYCYQTVLLGENMADEEQLWNVLLVVETFSNPSLESLKKWKMLLEFLKRGSKMLLEFLKR